MISKRISQKMQISQRILMFSGVALLSGAVAFAQQQPMGSASPSNPTAPTNSNPNMSTPDQMQLQENTAEGSTLDKAFVSKALEGGMAQIGLGKLAAEKGSGADVRQFGQKMVDDHTQMGNQMKLVGQQISVKAPKGLSKKDQQLVAKLETLSGAQFDDAYIAAMVKDQKSDAADFRQEAGNTQNPTVKQAAQVGGQVIDGHLQMIEQIAKSHNLKG